MLTPLVAALTCRSKNRGHLINLSAPPPSRFTAIKVPGLIESVYGCCLLRELELRRLECVSQRFLSRLDTTDSDEKRLRFDVLIGGLLVEAMAVEKVLPIRKTQLFELHENLERSSWIAHQFPREKSHGWCYPTYLARPEQISKGSSPSFISVSSC